ncbi:MAG: hypothetical protein J0H74_24710 [Chitinophagaceae bacterium]|nr:hypothetical protein [Chitinophagaceae bacterium]
MKNILCITLLVAGVAGNVFVYGQRARDSAVVRRPLKEFLHTSPSPVVPLPGSVRPGKAVFSGHGNIWAVPARGGLNGNSVRVMPPDNMPCLEPSLAATERMPIKKLDSRLVRPMPNGVPNGVPWVEIAPRRHPD